jgi:hypothetical protein
MLKYFLKTIQHKSINAKTLLNTLFFTYSQKYFLFNAKRSLVERIIIQNSQNTIVSGTILIQ